MIKRLVLIAVLIAASADVPLQAQNLRSQQDNELGINIHKEVSKLVGRVTNLYFTCEDLGGTVESFLSDNEPPLLVSHSIQPESPSPGDPIRISAEIFNNPDITRAQTISAYLYYSTGEGNDWEMAEMEPDPADIALWYADMPPMDEPGLVRYFFTAADDEGNYYMEVPETDLEWAAEGDFDFINILPDENELEGIVADDSDILSASVGYDGEYVYFNMIVEGDISGGTASPLAVNIYSVGIYPPVLGEIPAQEPVRILEHAQLGRAIGFPVIGLLDPGRDLANIESAGPEYYSYRNHLHMRVKKEELAGENDYVRAVFGTALGVECTPLAIKAQDISGFINLELGHRELVVE